MLICKEDARFSNSDLYELNEWAEMHGRVCPLMHLVTLGQAKSTYIIQEQGGKVTHSIKCPCGCQYNLGDFAQLAMPWEDLFDSLPPVYDKNSGSLPPIPWESVEPLSPVED